MDCLKPCASKVTCLYMDNVGSIMDANEHKNDHGYINTTQRQERENFGKGGSRVGQVSCGRRILASKYKHRAQTTIPSSSKRTQNKKINIREVELKDSTGMVLGRGIVESKLQTRDDVDGLILFPHQVAVRVMEVYASGVQKTNEDGQILRECIGQILRWSRTFIEEMHMESQERTTASTTTGAFDFNEDILLGDTIRATNMEVCEEEDEMENMEHLVSEGNMGTERIRSRISGVDGLPLPLKKRKYRMAQRVIKEKDVRRIGSSGAEKIFLAKVEEQLQSSICSKGCLQKLDAGAVLMKWFKAWGSHEYEERASWILENLTDCYNKGSDKFETRICGVSICNGCYAVALGYSKRRIEELKSDIRSMGITSEVFGVECSGRSSAVHGNIVHVPRTSVRVQAMESVFEKYVTETGCTQPHRQCRRRSDNQMVPLILLPMNTRREDVFHTVVADVERITKSKAPGPCSFYRLWCTEYTHVQIPPHSRFSKCQTCWEYRTCWEASTTNPAQKQLVRERLNLHQAVQVEERKDYWRAKQNAILYPNESMCLIVDGMDQNTTMVPKLRQAVKGIEGRYVKIHLCGILVHGEGLYSDVWIDSHHKHDSNQVITSIMNVINDVRDRRGGLLPPVLRIQADNCG